MHTVQLHRELAGITQSNGEREHHLCAAHETARQLFGLYGSQVVFLLFDVTKERIAHLLPQDAVLAEDILGITIQMVFKEADELPILEQVYDFSNQCSEHMTNYVDTDVCYCFFVDEHKMEIANRVQDIIKILENHSQQGSEQARVLESVLNNILKTPN